MKAPVPLKDQHLSYLHRPATGKGVSPPVSSNVQDLPFAQLTWENFERLCLRLAKQESDVELVRLYGERGDDQAGIDIYGRKSGGSRYVVYQCKNVGGFGPSHRLSYSVR